MIETTVESVGLCPSVTIAPDTSVTEAARQLRRTDVPALVVIESDAVVGVVSESDLVAMVAETDERPTVRALMSTPVTTTTPSATLSEAAETMRASGVKHLPVVSDGRFRGLLSARALAPYLPRHRLEIEWRDEPMRLESADDLGVTSGD
ncbi:CBS domain-containing protein [Natrinema halophilum]|uniref:CBS domain-containing protein n=1 Tax=Natrinema halophilum TaxID=1699371 RepID=A0A7D5KZE4_9EURY|nr:CBS domain-containing protein [Natrinema halophilum]QLG49080.1 CBS domain-containing protein [Natrinema halophilum]